MFEMQRTIELLRQLYRGKKQDMHEKAKNEEDTSMNEAEPPKGLEAFLQRVKQAEEEEKQTDEKKKDDVDMTDEEDE